MISAPSRGFLFDQVNVSAPKRSAFDLSFENKMSLNFGYLYPTLVQEVLPSDVFECKSSYLLKFEPTLAPIMHKLDAYVYTFFVPNRLIWSNWESFISPGNGKVKMSDMADFVSPIMPSFNVATAARRLHDNMDDGFSLKTNDRYFGVGSLADYLGLGLDFHRSGASGNLDNLDFSISQLPFRAYALIWNEYFRDQNFQDPIDIPLGDGPLDFTDDREALFSLQKKAWEKDLFTSALPTPQRGGTVLLPITGEANIVSKGDKAYISTDDKTGALTQETAQLRMLGNHGAQLQQISSKSTVTLETLRTSELAQNLKVDLSSAASTSIENLRVAYSLQDFLEKAALAGSRYVESILGHFGVRVEDYRMQRPEFLQGDRIPVQVSDVTQTSETSSTPQGNQSGLLRSSTDAPTFKYEAKEHGFIIQLLCVLPRTSYQQGMPPLFRRGLREGYLDFAFPEFAHLGEQEVYTSDLYANKNTVNRLFGYQPRYVDYKYNPDAVHGQFKTTLDFWHMGRIFNNQPLLNSSFIESSPSHRIFAVTSEDNDVIYCDIWHDLRAIRPLPQFGTPNI